MYNNIAFRIFFAVLVIFSTARAADDLDFEALSNPRNKMRALKRAEALFSLSEKRTDLAEQCLDEIMLIAKGKYGLAKKRSASSEERTVVGKAIAALKRLCPAKANPFEKQETVGEVDATITRHLAALKAGFDHIAELMSAGEATQVEVFGVSFELSKPTIIVAEPIKLLKIEHDGDADEGVIIDEALESSAAAQQSDRKLSSDATDGGEGEEDEEEDGPGLFETGELSIGALHQKKGTSTGIRKASNLKHGKANAKGKREGVDEKVGGGNRSSHVLVVGHDNSGGTGLEDAEVVVTVDDTAAQEEERRKKEKEAAETAKKAEVDGAHGRNSSMSSSGLPQQFPVIANNGTDAVVAQNHTNKGEEDDDDGVPKDQCCKRKKKEGGQKRKCTIC